MKFAELLAVAVITLTASSAMASDYRPAGGTGGGGQGPAGPSTLVVAGSSQIPLSGDNIVYVGSTSSTDVTDVGIPATAATTFNTVAVTLSDAPGTGTTWTITVMNDADETLQDATITGNSTSVEITGMTEAFSTGEKFSLKVEPTVGSPAPTIINFTAQAVLN